MKININEPWPVKLPPKTYDLMGLTEGELKLIYNLVAGCNCDDARMGYGVHTKKDLYLPLKEALGGTFSIDLPPLRPFGNRLTPIIEAVEKSVMVK